ncbi:hypothetical protein FB45DRAFT_490364 [Roridomyces roridus]|uniref:F-box domain-containing protein n=1 Tax=Roridomyces roridus TaxID=1738132 RepID=A0AAD7AZ53_9AGAR|nr:hypothetical protein FB45DRAFT_490364 [Roridomyces roridus]
MDLPDAPSSMRHQHLVNSNEPPNAVEESFFQDAALTTGARLTQLDQEIRALQAERAQLQVQQRQNHSVLSPLRRLPPEVLAEIFSWTLPPTEKLNGNVSDMKTSPWVLTQVSSRWRDISVSTSSLWCNISVAYGGESGEMLLNPRLEMIRTQVERSGARNLMIQFHASESHDSAVQVNLFQFLSSHSTRWEQLSIQIAAALVPHLVLLRGRLPVLQGIWTQWDTEDSEIGIDSIDCFEIAPSLLEMGISIESRYIPFVFPTCQLTAYRVGCPWDMHHRILKTAPNIVEAHIMIDADEDPWAEPSGEFIDMLHLRRLYVSDPEVFDYIRAPALAEVAMYIERDSSSESEYLDTFLARSSCAPRLLCLRGSPDPSITAAILNKHPSITSFALVHDPRLDSDEDEEDEPDDPMGRHCHLFTVGNGFGTAVAPHLSEISFGSQHASMHIDYSLFLKMLESRDRAADCALRTAALLTEFGPLPDPLTLARMDALRKDGLKFMFESGSEAAHTLECWTYAYPFETL